MAEETIRKKTKFAVLGSSVLHEPLLTLYSFIPFLLYRDLHASAFCVAVLTMLRPTVSLFSLYWSNHVDEKPYNLRKNILLTGLLGRIPFLMFPLFEDPWVIVLCAAFYMMTYRGGGPAWIEVLKINLTSAERHRTFSFGSAIAYGEGALLAIAFGQFLDQNVTAWRWLFPITGILGMIGVIFQAGVPLLKGEKLQKIEQEAPKKFAPFGPWKRMWDILKGSRDFTLFQWGYFLGGSALMIIQPALPVFFVDILGITYTDLAVAISVCKGLGFVGSSSLWGRGMDRINIYHFSSIVIFLFMLFPLFISFAVWDISWLYAAYFVYGVAQAGSHLCWNLSGPIFSKDRDSSLYSSVNVLMVGLRGVYAPPLGSLLLLVWGTTAPFALGVLLCLVSSGLMYQVGRNRTVGEQTA